MTGYGGGTPVEGTVFVQQYSTTLLWASEPCPALMGSWDRPIQRDEVVDFFLPLMIPPSTVVFGNRALKLKVESTPWTVAPGAHICASDQKMVTWAAGSGLGPWNPCSEVGPVTFLTGTDAH